MTTRTVTRPTPASRWLFGFAFAAMLGLPLAGCEKEEGPLEELGEELDEAVEEVDDAVDDATDGGGV